MNEGREVTAMAHNFAERIRAFHEVLPPDEQTMLQRVFALAERALTEMGDGDITGYASGRLQSLTSSLLTTTEVAEDAKRARTFFQALTGSRT